MIRAAAFALALGLAAPAAAEVVTLPGIQYEVLASGPKDGPMPTRADAVMMRYIGRLATGEVFSTSANNGAEPSQFGVREVIPGMSAALQLMRPGDRWRITLVPYLAYGRLGRKYQPPEATLKRDVPPDATLVFEVELVRIISPAPPAR
ncbi:FKBP-type peptidyl-prolyl cis-trans isomerase [Phenylobacterium sp.]|jgi:FKBP-type peptidyl-prolyl cis-trans isomerase|uniref:FKBP-type peptidyl-prolyl cis-trans isomerase n=1 Tax=Phenylobacterium sp. TaxID=1871053 RepID=UPI002F9524D8